MAIWSQHPAGRNPLVFQNTSLAFSGCKSVISRTVRDPGSAEPLMSNLTVFAVWFTPRSMPSSLNHFVSSSVVGSGGHCLLSTQSLSICPALARVRLATSTTSLPSILPKSTIQKEVLTANSIGVPHGPVYRPSRSMLVITSAPSSKSMCAGVLKSESASFRLDKSHLRATGIWCSGRSLVIFFSTYASTLTFSALSSMPDTWNHTETRVSVLGQATPSILAFFLLRGRHRCCANCSWTKEAEVPGSIRALAIVLDPLAVITFTLQVISSTCSWTLKAATHWRSQTRAYPGLCPG